MRVMGTEKLSPYGEVTWMDQKDAERLIYVFKVFFEEDHFKPPSAWMVVNALGDRVYFKSRSRASAQLLCDELLGTGKYTVVSDKVGKVE